MREIAEGASEREKLEMGFCNLREEKEKESGGIEKFQGENGH